MSSSLHCHCRYHHHHRHRLLQFLVGISLSVLYYRCDKYCIVIGNYTNNNNTTTHLFSLLAAIDAAEISYMVSPSSLSSLLFTMTCCLLLGIMSSMYLKSTMTLFKKSSSPERVLYGSARLSIRLWYGTSNFQTHRSYLWVWHGTIVIRYLLYLFHES